MKDYNFSFFGFDKLNYVVDNLLDILFNEATEIPLSNILDKICVSPPYFTFKKIYKYQNILISQVKTEQPIDNEISSMSIGEAGRHMAILGTCVCAIDQGDKYYYLVKNAKTNLVIQDIGSLCSNKSNLYIAIESRYIDNKIANAYGILFNTEKKVIYQLEASYNKVKTNLFSRLFKKQAQELQTKKESPYTKKIILQNEEISQERLMVSIPEIEKEKCAGHFKNYPILPTAFIIYNIISHVGNFLLEKSNKKRYYITEVYLSLFELLFLKTKKEVEIKYKNINRSNLYKVYCTIKQDKKKNANILFFVNLI